MSEESVEFRLFGGVEADRDGTPIDLGHARQLCVLAVLLVGANTTVSVDELLDRVWAGEPPARAKESLQSYLTRLRRALPELTITRHSAGYLLAVDELTVDLHRFRELAATAQKTGDPAEFEQALALWHGDPLAGLDVPWARTLRTALARNAPRSNSTSSTPNSATAGTTTSCRAWPPASSQPVRRTPRRPIPARPLPLRPSAPTP